MQKAMMGHDNSWKRMTSNERKYVIMEERMLWSYIWLQLILRYPYSSTWPPACFTTSFQRKHCRLKKTVRADSNWASNTGSIFCFFRFVFVHLLFCQFSLQFAAFWSWKLPFQRYCNILEFEPLIFHDICNILVLKLFMLDGILGIGAIWGLFRFVSGFIRDWFRLV